ncbi:hypothetical protein P0D75_18370 [Paraburkholderia sediminicola]|uniref:hypothetical protein n=1 Tax=Paraburkholderia sediminicola TaxID=458836 RepID=UPI0038BC373A
MSADSHTGRDPYTNSGSDTKRHYDQGNIMDRFNRSSVGGAKPNMSDPHIQNRAVKPSTEGVIKNRRARGVGLAPA